MRYEIWRGKNESERGSFVIKYGGERNGRRHGWRE